ncbi:kinase-like domain-containing protein [Suillus lakei]|nr:kinase-like domain-containing protein [Suillus lakei]KAG1737257.1 kinase-like domain-containing protein [Suillus lakei]
MCADNRCLTVVAMCFDCSTVYASTISRVMLANVVIDGGNIWWPLLRCGCSKTIHKLACPQLIIEAKLTQKFVTRPSSEPRSGASYDVPGIMSTHIIANIPVLSYPSDSESADPPAQTTPQISPPPRVYGPFRVWRALSKGASATAMGAEDITSNRLICLKVFRKDRLKHDYTEEVLVNELEVYKRLASSRPRPESMFLMGLELTFQTKDAICFAMDLMVCDLNTCIRTQSIYCSQNACRWTVQLAHGINALHEMGIIHRDIKPGNILIDTRQNIRIADFGLSYLHEGPLEPQGAYTADVAGTEGYMAPEIMDNKDCPDLMNYGAPVDWWALGCVVFELLSEGQQTLFDTEEDYEHYVSWRSGPTMTYTDFPAFKDLPEKIVHLMAGLLDPVPSERYGFQEVADHRSFLVEDGASVFVDPYSRALRREAKPDFLPDLRRGKEIYTAEIWDRLPSSEHPRVANVDWIKPPCPSPS